MKYILAFVILLQTLHSYGQEIIYHHTFNVYRKNADVIKEYVKKYAVENFGELFYAGKYADTLIPEVYWEGAVTEIDGAIVAKGIFHYEKGKSKCLGELYIYGEIAFLAKDNRTRIELRNANYVSNGGSGGCLSIGTYNQLLECEKCAIALDRMRESHYLWFKEVKRDFHEYLKKASWNDESNW